MEIQGLEIHRLNHTAFQFRGSKTVYTDPYQLPEGLAPADLILITHEHFDHMSRADVDKITTEQTSIVAIPSCEEALRGVTAKAVHYVRPGDRLTVEGIAIEAYPAYNVNKFRSPGVPFHPKEDGKVGYVFTLDGKRIYFAGDLDVIPELAEIKNIDIALLPVSGKYVMTPEEAAEAARILRPKVAIPMHYGAIVATEAEARAFQQLAGCPVEIL